MNPVETANATRSTSCLILHGLGGGPYELGPLITAVGTRGLSSRGMN